MRQDNSALDVPFAGKDTAMAVKTLTDDWVIIGPIRIAQHLASVWHTLAPNELTRDGAHWRLNGANIYSSMYANHPWAEWAATNFENYSWLYFYACDLCDEYKVRFGPKAAQPVQHGIKTMLSALENAPDCLPDGEWMEPTFAKDIE